MSTTTHANLIILIPEHVKLQSFRYISNEILWKYHNSQLPPELESEYVEQPSGNLIWNYTPSSAKIDHEAWLKTWVPLPNGIQGAGFGPEEFKVPSGFNGNVYELEVPRGGVHVCLNFRADPGYGKFPVFYTLPWQATSRLPLDEKADHPLNPGECSDKSSSCYADHDLDFLNQANDLRKLVDIKSPESFKFLTWGPISGIGVSDPTNPSEYIYENFKNNVSWNVSVDGRSASLEFCLFAPRAEHSKEWSDYSHWSFRYDPVIYFEEEAYGPEWLYKVQPPGIVNIPFNFFSITPDDTNFINAVDEDQFNVDNRKKLTLKKVDQKFISGLLDTTGKQKTLAEILSAANEERKTLAEILSSKVDKVEGKALSTLDFTEELSAKLTGIEFGAQVNLIEGIKLNGVLLTVGEDKIVDLGAISLGSGDGTYSLPVATTDVLGGVKSIAPILDNDGKVINSSELENKVIVADDGTMEVYNLNVTKLEQTEGDHLILNGGRAF